MIYCNPNPFNREENFCMKTLKIGVLGAGNIGRVHIERLRKVQGVEIAAVSDASEAAASAAARDYSIPDSFTDYRSLLKVRDIDGVYICTPNAFHRDMAVNSLRAGKHVFCEKPMALNSAEASRMLDAARENERMLFMGFCNRFRGKSQGLKKMIDAGKLGEIYHCVVNVVRRRGVPAIGSWFTQKSLSGGGALIDIGVHMLDLNLWFMGFPKPVSVSGATYMKFGHRKDYVYTSMWGKPVPGGIFDVDDYATALIRFENGSTLTLECSWAANVPTTSWTSYVMGDKGGAKFDLNADLEVYTEDTGFIADLRPQFVEPDVYQAINDHFVCCLRGTAQPLCTAEQGLVVQKIIDGIYKSSQMGKEVRV